MPHQTFTLSTQIARPPQEVFAWHERPGAFARLCPPWEQVETLAESGGIRDGARVTVRTKVGPGWTRWTVEHRDYLAGVQFRDVQLSGPFARWEHLHRFESDGAGGCILTDTIEFEPPGGAAGRVISTPFILRKLQRMFRWRHATTRADLEVTLPSTHRPKRRVLIAGASGSIGRVLVPFLQTQGHEVIRLVRRRPSGTGEVMWDPTTGGLNTAELGVIDAIVNLSGENVAGGRWSIGRRERILRSRVDATRTLVTAISRMVQKPEVMVSASAIGFYGDRDEEVLSEASPIGHGFLPEVCLAWETHAEGAARLGVRTALLRFGVVLTPEAGALAKLLPVFKAGAGGALGNGRQWMSWISIDDAVGAIYHAITSSAVSGAVNAVSPNPVTNRQFTVTLANVLHRPASFAVPAPVLRGIFGAMAEETMLASACVSPDVLLGSGYRFRHPELEAALRHVLGRT